MTREGPERVGEVMTTELRTVLPDDPLDAAAEAMGRYGVRQLLVVDEDGRLAGLLTYRALLRLVAARRHGESAGPGRVQRFMEPAAVTFAPDTPLLEAIRAMISGAISAAPVLEDGRLVGVVSEHDVVAVAARLLDHGNP